MIQRLYRKIRLSWQSTGMPACWDTWPLKPPD